MAQAQVLHVRGLSHGMEGQSLCFLQQAGQPMLTPVVLGNDLSADIPIPEALCARQALLSQTPQGVRIVAPVESPGLWHQPSGVAFREHLVQEGHSVDLRLGDEGPRLRVGLGLAVPLGKYWLVGKLGQGGMGDVYAAWDGSLQRLAVLKILREDRQSGDPELANRLIDEARALAQLEHPGIVRVYEAGALCGLPHLSMEYVRGVTLAQLGAACREQNMRLPAALVAVLVLPCLAALQAAHGLAFPIIHRDVSMNNIMLSPTGTKLIDFGLARARGRLCESFTKNESIAGCPPYMSPEQVNAPKTVDGRSDLYSLAVVLYELCAGHSPFLRDNLVSTLQAVLHDTPPPLHTLRPDIGVGFSRLVQRALAKRPADRPQTAAEFAAILRAEEPLCASEYASVLELLRQRLKLALYGPWPALLREVPGWAKRVRTQPTGSPAATPPTGTGPTKGGQDPADSASPNVRRNAETELPPLHLPLPTGQGAASWKSPTGASLYITMMAMGGRNLPWQATVPFDAQAIAEQGQPVLRLHCGEGLLELRVTTQAVLGEQAARLYVGSCRSESIRPSFVLPPHADQTRLFIGHHRRAHIELWQTSGEHHPGPPQPLVLAMPMLGVTVVCNVPASRLLTFYHPPSTGQPGNLIVVTL